MHLIDKQHSLQKGALRMAHINISLAYSAFVCSCVSVHVGVCVLCAIDPCGLKINKERKEKYRVAQKSKPQKLIIIKSY